MAKTNFETLVEAAKRDLAEDMFRITSGNSHMHAEVKGKRLGLDLALELFRKAAQTDLGEDGV